MRFLKISLISLLVLAGLFLLAAIILPRVYKDDVLAVIREESNKNLQATIDFSDIDLSLFRQFPKLSVRIDELSIIGQNEFDGYPLLDCTSAEIAVSVWDLFRKNVPLRIQTLNLVDPEIQVLILENGRANYDITLPDSTNMEESNAGSAIEGAIQSYALTNGRLRYEDRTMPLVFSLKGLDHSGKGDFTQNTFLLSTHTTADSMDLQYDGIAYFMDVHTTMEADLDIDLDKMRFAFADNTLTLNDLQLIGQGSIEMPESDILMDLSFSSTQSDLKNFWSMIPGAYTADYADLKSEGTFTLEAWLKGIYNESSFPAFAFHSILKNGRIQYPDLPTAIEDIQAEIHLEQPGTSLNELKINIPTFRLKIKDQGLQGRFAATEIMTDPRVDAQVQGVLDLSAVKQAFPVDATTLSGRIAMDVGVKARMSDLDASRADQVDLHGSASIQDLIYQTSGAPKVTISRGELQFSPQAVEASDFRIQAGRSDLALQARFDNILAVLHPERTLKGRIQVTSSLVDLDEWQDKNAATTAAPTSPTADEVTLPVEQFDLSVDMTIGKLIANDMSVSDLRLVGKAGPTTIDVTQLSGTIGESDFRLRGQLENALAWLSDQAILQGNIHLDSRVFNLNQFMTADEVPATEGDTDFSTIPVPARVNLTATANIDHLIYTNLDLKHVTVQVDISNEEARLSQFEADGLGGKLVAAGSYNTQNIEKPVFHFKYDLQKLDFQQVFTKFNSFRTLAPIGQYIQGTFSSNMLMDGFLKSDMTPDLSTLEAAGFLETYNSLVKGFKPVEGLAEKLNIKELKTLDLKGTKNWFEVKNGALELKDFDYTTHDIAMIIGGSHSLTQDMNYHVKARIPRNLMEKNAITSSANAGLKWLESEAAKKGIPVTAGEYINVLVKVGGTIQSPTYGIQLLGTDGESTVGDQLEAQAGAITKQVKDSLERVGRQKVEEIKVEATRQAQARLDSLKKQANQQIDTTLAKAKLEALKKAEEVLGKEAGKKIEEIGGDKAKQEADKIKEKLKNWDPLKKKKDGN
ncbi:MAG: hypothetical protein K9I85_00535 [Saprospiraceae bacterium]|nr:hypothetical protein [Saprospiraceae bacterium]